MQALETGNSSAALLHPSFGPPTMGGLLNLSKPLPPSLLVLKIFSPCFSRSFSKEKRNADVLKFDERGQASYLKFCGACLSQSRLNKSPWPLQLIAVVILCLLIFFTLALFVLGLKILSPCFSRRYTREQQNSNEIDFETGQAR